MEKYGNSGADAAPRRAETPGSIPLDCTGLSRFPEVNFRKNSFHSEEISHTLRPASSTLQVRRAARRGRAAGNPPRTNAHRKPQRMDRIAGTCKPAAHECAQEASTHGPRSGHVRTRRAQMDTKSPRRGTGGFSCDFVLSFVDVYVITSRSRPLCFRGSCSP